MSYVIDAIAKLQPILHFSLCSYSSAMHFHFHTQTYTDGYRKTRALLHTVVINGAHKFHILISLN